MDYLVKWTYLCTLLKYQNHLMTACSLTQNFITQSIKSILSVVDSIKIMYNITPNIKSIKLYIFFK